MSISDAVLSNPRPWTFSRGELNAGLRLNTGDHGLVIQDMQEYDIPQRRPAVGRIRGLRVICKGERGQTTIDLVIKEPQGITRTGTAGAGLREACFYRTIAEQVPLRMPRLLASDPEGKWLAFELLSGGLPPEQWKAADYRLAVEQLAGLHDRFWGLDEDLKAYAWLARPLDADYEIYTKAASAGLRQLLNSPKANLLNQDKSLIKSLERLTRHADKIGQALLDQPATLLHGDYWPGNLDRHTDGGLVAFDWQRAGIGPGILDLITFIQKSQWWFEKMPVTPLDLTGWYRTCLASYNGYTWSDEAWAKLWDFALLWTFLADWVDRLATIPAPVLQTSYRHLENLWLKPVEAAVERHLPEI